MEIVREGSTSYLTVTFLDKDGEEAAPVSATWEVVDVDSGTILKAIGGLSPAASVELTLTPAMNAIIGTPRAAEKRRVTIKASYGDTDKVNSEYVYMVKNLVNAPTPP